MDVKMANKKIFVLKLRELIYTAIFLFFGIVLILLLVAMFSGKKADSGKASGQNAPGDLSTSEPAAGASGANQSGEGTAEDGKGNSYADSDLTQTFRPGVYTADFTLADNTFTLELLVDADRVKAVNLRTVNPASGVTGEEYIATMYPLMEPALDVIESNLVEGTSLSDITFSVENQYTGTLLVSAIGQLLNKAYR